MRGLITYLLLRSIMAAINFFPIAVSTSIVRRIGDIAYCVLGSRRKIALENLDIAFGNSKSIVQKKKIAKESFRHFATSLMELARIPKFVKVATEHFQFKGLEHIERAFAKGKGLVLVMSHLGSWEYGAFLPYIKQIPSIILGKRIRNKYIYNWVKDLRLRASLKHTDKTDGVRKVLSELKANHLVAIAIDQWAGNDELWVKFFDRAVSTTSFPARLVRKTGCALIPLYCIRRSPGEYEIHIFEEVSVPEDNENAVEFVTEKLNSFLQEKICQFPEQWIWAHRRFKGKKEYQ